jgi:hypothetical protein
LAVREVVHERLHHVDTATRASWTLIHDSTLHALISGGVEDCHSLATERIVVARRAHELKWQRDTVAGWVYVDATCAEAATAIVRDVALARGILAQARRVVRR